VLVARLLVATEPGRVATLVVMRAARRRLCSTVHLGRCRFPLIIGHLSVSPVVRVVVVGLLGQQGLELSVRQLGNRRRGVAGLSFGLQAATAALDAVQASAQRAKPFGPLGVGALRVSFTMVHVVSPVVWAGFLPDLL